MKPFVVAAGVVLAGVAHAGHEFPFYPSFYPQEITIESLDAQAASQRLADGTLHAYAGALESAPAKTGAVESLAGYIVARGCVDAGAMKTALPAGAVRHPYPVTPFHDDYLHHADRVEAIGAEKKFSGKLEIVDLNALLARAGTAPWSRQGWFHAYLLLAPAVADARIESAVRRLTRGEYRSLRQRIQLERDLVALLQSGCERVVLGYTVRREYYGTQYSQGVENVGYDALAGLASAIFPRTVKLRDFPWNGWLNVAVPAPPAAAWNPVRGGFGDAFGRMLWSALADPAFLPSPHGGGWIENRVHASVKKGDKPDAARVVYRLHNSAFHDGTKMSFADVVYAHAVAKRPPKDLRLLRVETETLAFGEDKLTYEVPVIEVHLHGAARRDAAIVAPPWTTLPWHLLALFDEAARRGYLQLADFDPVRDAALVRRLGELARELEERSYVPPPLKAYVNAQEARARYGRLREFHAAHGHWLVTNGPYLLRSWDGTKAVLGVFRDPSYPNGLGMFNRYAVPLKAYVARIDRRGSGAKVHLETERLEREGREVRVVRGAPEEKRLPVCRYLLLRSDGTVAAAGEVRASGVGTCDLPLPRPAQGSSGLIVAAVLEDAAANAPIRIVPWE